MKSFRDYLVSRRTLNNPAGQFTRQMRDYPDLEEIEEWPQLRAFIYRKSHPSKIKDMLAAAEPVWKGYRAFVLKRRREEQS
jgi:hypothetical protein